VAAPLARVGLIPIQMFRVGLDDLAIFQEKQSSLFGGDAGDKGIGVVQ
jgi:hypothetical protein